ncbi:MAG: peptidase MA family metallohydrolase [Phycisphaerales bacterium]
MPDRSVVCPILLALASTAAALQTAPDAMARQPVRERSPAEIAAPAEVRPPIDRLSPLVRQAIEAPFLSDDEAADLRVFHGVWWLTDLNDPARCARAALIAGVIDDPSLSNDDAAPLDRAEGALLRGELDAALDILEANENEAVSFRGRRIIAEALELMGRFGDADAVLDPVVAAATARQLTATDAVEVVRAMRIRARIRGEGAGAYQAMAELLARASQDLDRFHWPALIEEADLFHSHENFSDASQAASQALALCPQSAAALHRLGLMGVETFDFDRALAIADELDRIAREFSGDPEAQSVFAAMLRARTMLRESEPDEAVALLSPWEQRFPDMPALLALRCAAEALRYDTEALEELLAVYDRVTGGSPLALFEVGKALSDARQYELAAEYLTRAHRIQPKWAKPLSALGLLEIQAGRDIVARDTLRQAQSLDPFNVRVRNSLALVEGVLEFETIDIDHFRIRYRQGPDAVLARELVDGLRRMHAIVTDAMDFVPERRTLVELMPNHEWFSVRITGVRQVFTIAAATGPVIAMETPRIGAGNTVGPYDWERVLRHEYTHTVTLARTRNRIPHWFTEAAAVAMELAPRDYDRCMLLYNALTNETLFPLDEINVKFIRPREPTDRAQAYAQGHWMWEFIVDTWGPQAPLDMMDLYAEGTRERQAIRKLFDLSTDEFMERFRDWARADVRSWGLMAEPSLESLRVDTALGDEATRIAIDASLSDFAMATGRAIVGIGPPPSQPIELPPVSRSLVQRWLEEYPEHPDVLELMIDYAVPSAGGPIDEEGVALLERYAAARPIDPMPHQRLARHYLDSPEPWRAIPHLEWLDAREQYSPQYALERARLHAARQEWDSAARAIERAIGIAPFDATHRELAATIHIQRRDFDAAERQLRALSELEPQREIHQRRLEALQRLRG